MGRLRTGQNRPLVGNKRVSHLVCPVKASLVACLFGTQFSSVIQSVAPSLQSDDLGMVQETVQDGPSHRGGPQHLHPVFQGRLVIMIIVPFS